MGYEGYKKMSKKYIRVVEILKMCFKLLRRKKSVIVIEVSRDDIVKILQNEQISPIANYYNLRPFVVNSILYTIGQNIEWSQLQLEKAKYIFEFEEWNKENQK